MTDGFGPKLGLVLKALTITNGRLAADLAVDKSLVGRWVAGTVTPSAHNLARLTHHLAQRLPGLTLLDWDQPLAALAARAAGESGRGAGADQVAQAARPSIAVLPFTLVGDGGAHAVIADALPQDLISDLARLRWLFVIARASSFRLRDADDIGEVGRILGVRYCLTGTVEIVGIRLVVSVELADTRDRGIIWSDRFTTTADGVHELRTRIAATVIAALEIQIPAHEARAAWQSGGDALDAWGSYHRGLQHMYRFTRADTAIAIDLFRRAVAQDPGFTRAHGGLSFSHFQNAFLDYTGDVVGESVRARHHAERAVELDALDPFANLTMGRAHWLDGDVGGSVAWLDRAISLNPNYAHAIYSRGWADTVLCRSASGQSHCDDAMALSPIDPLHYAMLSTRALAHAIGGDYSAAAEWGERGAAAPGAHVMIVVCAAACLALSGDVDRARFWADTARRRHASVSRDDFFRCFPLSDEGARRQIATGLARAGI